MDRYWVTGTLARWYPARGFGFAVMDGQRGAARTISTANYEVDGGGGKVVSCCSGAVRPRHPAIRDAPQALGNDSQGGGISWHLSF
jgi:hypothetical protein